MAERLTVSGATTQRDIDRLLEVSNCNQFGRNGAYYKLQHYEDLEEQSRLIELPCKIGDTVYVIPSKVNYELNILNHHEENNRVYEQTVHSIQMFSNYRYVLATCDGLCSILSDFYKETWFLTREEAEAALKGAEDGRTSKSNQANL